MNTFMKDLYFDTKAPEKTSKLLSRKVALMFDGWSHVSTLHVAIFESFEGSDKLCRTALLTFSRLFDESHLNAAA